MDAEMILRTKMLTDKARNFDLVGKCVMHKKKPPNG